MSKQQSAALAVPTAAAPADDTVFATTRLGQIRASYTNRTRFNETALQELAANIKAVGIVQPILIRPVTPTDEAPQPFEIVAGERRFRAATIAGLELVPTMIRTLTDNQALEIQLLENLQREDPHPMEEAEGYQTLMLKSGYNADQLAEKLNKSRSYIYGRLKLCALALDVREQFLDNKIPASTALLIARIPVAALQTRALTEITEERGWPHNQAMSYREAVQHIQARYTMDLTIAKWPLSDAKLIPIAGACTKCPKKTGNQPEIFPDIKSADVCTDPDCYREKRGAYMERLVVNANKAGIPVHEGEEATALLRYRNSSDTELVTETSGIFVFPRNSPSTKNQGTVSDFIKRDQMPAPAAYAKNSDGDLVAFYKKDTLQTMLEAVGALENPEQHAARMAAKDASPAGQENQKLEREQQEKIDAQHHAIDVENEFRVTLYKKLRTRGENGFSLTSLRAFTKMILEEYALPDDLQDLYTFDPSETTQVAAYIDQASLPEVQLLLVDAMLGDCFCVNSWSMKQDSYSYDALVSMSKAEDIDVTMVRADVELRMAPIETLQATQFDRFLMVAPDRVNELAEFILGGDPLAVRPLELAAIKNGFIYGPQEGQSGSKACFYKPTAQAAVATEVADTNINEQDVAAPQATPAIKDQNEAVADAAAQPDSSVADGDYVDPTDYVDAPAATPSPKPASKKTKSKTQPLAPASAWPFPKSPAEKAADSTTTESA